MAQFDIVIVGGGINGDGIARDAAGRGLRVALVEQHDLASGTSSASSKLIHGGLRYLEHGAFRLVREALIEREVLLRAAPHLIQPMRFVLPPHHAGLRPAWMLRLGLFLYDHLGGRKLLPATRLLDLAREPSGKPLQARYTRGFEYSDCWVDDARLVVLNAVDAAARGAAVRTRARCVRAERGQAEWRLDVQSETGREQISARVLVNATGPWIAQFSEKVLGLRTPTPVRLVRGSHIVVPRLFDHDRAYIFQQSDGRVVFAIPYQHDFTLIGTTDIDHTGDPGGPEPTAQEIDYLCAAASEYFRAAVTPDRVVWRFAGIRSLYDDGASAAKDATRDYVLAVDGEGGAPLLSVYGGKITTYRRLAEAALSRLSRYLPVGRPWTAETPLPGGDFPWDGAEALVADAMRRWPFLSQQHAERLVRAYGTRVPHVLGEASSAAEAGPMFGGLISGAEVSYLMREEWAVSPEDVLWRRTKLGLRLSAEEQGALARFMGREPDRTAAE